MSDSDVKVYGWDTDTIDDPNEGGRNLLEEGEYPFTVVKWTRGQFNGSVKTPKCPKVVLTLRIDGGEQGESTITDDLILASSFDWKLCQFFTSIGLRKHGDKELPLADFLAQMITRTGTLRLTQKVSQAGNTYNDVGAYLEGGVVNPPTPTPAPPVQQQMATAAAFPGTSQYDDDVPF